jgi:hypothetical protein
MNRVDFQLFLRYALIRFLKDMSEDTCAERTARAPYSKLLRCASY